MRGHEGEHRREHVLHIGDVRFASGALIKNLKIACWTLGELNDARDNAILLCHGGSGDRHWPLSFCSQGDCFDPQRWFVISVDMPGGGGSSRARDEQDFPADYSISDLTSAVIECIHSMQLPSLRAFCGPSMASLIGLELAVREPALLRGLVFWSGGYGCDTYAQAVATTLVDMLQLDATVDGMRAAVMAYLPALVEPDLLAGNIHMGIVEQIVNQWTTHWRADELIARYKAMAECDLVRQYGGEAELAAAISCPVLCLAVSSDRIFPPQQMQMLAQRKPDMRMLSIDSDWGHMAYTLPPGSPEHTFFNQQTAKFLCAPIHTPLP